MADIETLLASWDKLAAERLAVHDDMKHCGVNSQARQRLNRLSGVLGRKLADIGAELRAAGVEPPHRRRA